MTKINDRFEDNTLEPVDVVIPLFTAPDNFYDALKGYYSDIPINRLLIANGGASVKLLQILKDFPRVLIIDHTKIKSLGYSLQLLFDMIETEWFVYFHSDVSIPLGWYDEMSKYKKQYDLFECKRINPVTMIQNEYDYFIKTFRSNSGSQMGKAKIFKNIRKVDDDYLYRCEDEFFKQEIEKQGYRYGKVVSTFHYHRLDAKKPYDLKSRNKTVLKELIKYFPSKIDYNRSSVQGLVEYFSLQGEWDVEYWTNWASKTNPEWVPILKIISKKQKQKEIMISIGKTLGLKDSFIGKFFSKRFLRI